MARSGAEDKRLRVGRREWSPPADVAGFLFKEVRGPRPEVRGAGPWAGETIAYPFDQGGLLQVFKREPPGRRERGRGRSRLDDVPARLPCWCPSRPSARLPGSRPQPRCPLRLIGLAVILAVSLVLALLAAHAQQASKVYRIGFLGDSPAAFSEPTEAYGRTR